MNPNPEVGGYPGEGSSVQQGNCRRSRKRWSDILRDGDPVIIQPQFDVEQPGFFSEKDIRKDGNSYEGICNRCGRDAWPRCDE